LLQWLKKHLGGFVRQDLHHPGNKKFWRWRITTHRALAVIKLVLPFLIVKRPQAELLLRFYDEIPRYVSTHAHPVQLPLKEPLKSIFLSIKLLNAHKRSI